MNLIEAWKRCSDNSVLANGQTIYGAKSSLGSLPELLGRLTEGAIISEDWRIAREEHYEIFNDCKVENRTAIDQRLTGFARGISGPRDMATDILVFVQLLKARDAVNIQIKVEWLE